MLFSIDLSLMMSSHIPWSESIVNVSNVNDIFVFPCSETYVNFTLVNNGDKATKLINANDDCIQLDKTIYYICLLW